MRIEEIWKWRREVLRKPSGGWKEDVFLLIYKKLDEIGPKSWAECVSEYDALRVAKCYLEVIRIAGGILNEIPNADKARALYFDTAEQAELFEKQLRAVTDSAIALEDLKNVLGRCLALTRDSVDRLSNIRSRAGF